MLNLVRLRNLRVIGQLKALSSGFVAGVDRGGAMVTMWGLRAELSISGVVNGSTPRVLAEANLVLKSIWPS